MSFIHNYILNFVIFRKGNVHAAASNIPFSWLIFPLSVNLQLLRLENNRFFRCLPTSDTFVRKTYQILGVNPPLIHSFLTTFYTKYVENAITFLFYVKIQNMYTSKGQNFNLTIYQKCFLYLPCPFHLRICQKERSNALCIVFYHRFRHIIVKCTGTLIGTA